MRALRIVVAALTVLFGAYLLLLAYGVIIAMQERTQGWHITPVPTYPVVRIVTYLTVAVGLQSTGAWLLTPQAAKKGGPLFWSRYAARVALCIGVCFAVALVSAFVVQALLDAGII